MENLSRRAILAAAAVSVSLPVLDAALGDGRLARAAAPESGAAPAAAGDWFDTKLKPTDAKDKQFTAVTGKKMMLTRNGDSIVALTEVCTHKGCTMKPQAGQDTITCGCHKSIFNLDGTVAHGPATKPLDHYAIRLGDNGTIEVNMGQVVAKDAKEAVLVNKLAATQSA